MVSSDKHDISRQRIRPTRTRTISKILRDRQIERDGVVTLKFVEVFRSKHTCRSASVRFSQAAGWSTATSNDKIRTIWRTNMSKSASQKEMGVRELRADEVGAVTGGIMGGCISLAKLKIFLPQEPAPFVDQFAKRLPSWVRPL